MVGEGASPSLLLITKPTAAIIRRIDVVAKRCLELAAKGKCKFVDTTLVEAAIRDYVEGPNRQLASACGFFSLFSSGNQFAAKDISQPLWRGIRCFDQLARNETCHEPMSPSIRCVVINKKVVGVPSGIRQILHRFPIRVRNRFQRYRLPAATHSNQDAPDIQVGVLRGDKKDLCGVARLSCALQEIRVDGQILYCEGKPLT